jgi:hypothetical protein
MRRASPLRWALLASPLCGAILALLAPAHAHAQAAPLSAGERVPAVLLVLAPGSTDSTLEPRVLAAARRALDAHTSLDVAPASALGVRPDSVARCPPQTLLSCVVGVVDARAARAGAVIIVSLLPVARGRVQVRGLVVDLPAARAQLETPRPDSEDALVAENRLYAHAYEAEPAELEPHDDARLGEYLAALAARVPRHVPSAAPLGAVILGAAEPYAELTLDDRVLGGLVAGTTTLTDVRPGTRALRVTDLRGGVHEHVLEVRSARATRVALARVELGDARPDFGAAHRAVRWGGVGAVAAGVVLGVVAASLGGVTEGCLLRAGASAATETCEGLGAPTLGFDASRAPSARAADVNPPGLAPLPLGLALAATGATWLVGSLVWGDDETPPWWALAAGVALGAATLTVATVASP